MGKRKTLKILFIGNSFTQRNDLPGQIAQLAQPAGVIVEHRLISAGGASLRTHWNKGEAQKAITSGDWDFVVLQEQSTLPVKNAERFHENVRLFDPVIRDAGAKTALYLTWARAREPGNQAAITKAYTAIGREIGATVVPAGVVWEHALADPACPPLHDSDGSHPSPVGSLLVAAVFVQTLVGTLPDRPPGEAGELLSWPLIKRLVAKPRRRGAR